MLADRTTQETTSALNSIRDTISLITGVIIASVLIAGFGAVLVRHYVGLVRAANVKLAAANNALRDAKCVAEDASRAKSDFLSTFSHELRTPLNAVIGFSSMLSNPRLGMVNHAEQREYAEHINASGVHLLNLINDILDFSKAGAGKLTLSESSFRLGHLITQVAALFRARAAEAGLRLVVDVDDAPLMFGDERRVKQILLNLMSNSMKFTQSGGTITLRGDVRNGSPFLSVIDTGIGIAPDDLPKVLQPFGQVDSSLSRNYEGTGLGLPLVATMAELHGGELQLESKVGAGTKAIVVFPATRFLGMDLPQERAA